MFFPIWFSELFVTGVEQKTALRDSYQEHQTNSCVVSLLIAGIEE